MMELLIGLVLGFALGLIIVSILSAGAYQAGRRDQARADAWMQGQRAERDR